jgi:hypothetical protein
LISYHQPLPRGSVGTASARATETGYSTGSACGGRAGGARWLKLRGRSPRLRHGCSAYAQNSVLGHAVTCPETNPLHEQGSEVGASAGGFQGLGHGGGLSAVTRGLPLPEGAHRFLSGSPD